MSEGLDPRMLLRGYAAGIFPMADSRDAGDIFWVEPRNRAIIPLQSFHLSRSLAKRVRSGCFTVTRDRAFHEVLLACADREETWINQVIERATLGLNAVGHAHSIECWHEGGLVGGLYGVKLGRAFFGKSMFSRMTDASKVALAWLVARLRVGGFHPARLPVHDAPSRLTRRDDGQSGQLCRIAFVGIVARRCHAWRRAFLNGFGAIRGGRFAGGGRARPRLRSARPAA